MALLDLTGKVVQVILRQGPHERPHDLGLGGAAEVLGHAADHQQGAVYGGAANHDGEEASREEGRVSVQRPGVLPVWSKNARGAVRQQGA